MLARIKEFCFNHSPWRIDYLGGLIYPSDSLTEPRIVVHLSELAFDSGDPMSNTSLVTPNRHEAVTVNVGQISLLKLGSVWIDGLRVPPAEALSEKSFSLTHDQLRLIRFDDNVNIEGEPQALFTPTRYRIGEKATKELAGSWLAVAEQPGSGAAFLAIPASIIFQTCFATSSKAVRRLVFGEIDKIVDPSCGFLSGEPGTYFVELFKDFRDAEAKAIANLKADHVGRAEYDRFRNSLVAASANQDRGRPDRAGLPHMKLSLPFSNPVHLTVLGKSLPFEITRNGKARKVFGFLATEIVELNTRLVFDRLVIGRKNDNQKGANGDDPSLPTGWSHATKPLSPRPDQHLPLASGPVPDQTLEQQDLVTAGGFNAEGLKIVDNPKEVQKYKIRIRISLDGTQHQGDGTTGDPGPGNSGSPPTVVTPQQPPAVPVTLDDFFKVLQALRADGLAFQTLAVSPNYRRRDHDTDVVNFLPWRINRVRSWHLIGYGRNTAPRAYVVAELQRGGVWHYLIELERKGSGTFALQHIRHHRGDRIDKDLIAQFMVNVAVDNGWSASDRYKNWVFKGINHPKNRDAKRFAQLIARAL